MTAAQEARGHVRRGRQETINEGSSRKARSVTFLPRFVTGSGFPTLSRLAQFNPAAARVESEPGEHSRLRLSLSSCLWQKSAPSYIYIHDTRRWVSLVLIRALVCRFRCSSIAARVLAGPAARTCQTASLDGAPKNQTLAVSAGLLPCAVETPELVPRESGKWSKKLKSTAPRTQIIQNQGGGGGT